MTDDERTKYSSLAEQIQKDVQNRGWTWERIVTLNKLICDASDQPHAIREEPSFFNVLRGVDPLVNLDGFCGFPDMIAKEHWFVEGNKRTASCIAVCLALEGV